MIRPGRSVRGSPAAMGVSAASTPAPQGRTGRAFLPSAPRAYAMDPVDIGVPKPILERLPDDDQVAAHDMQEAVAGWERRINHAVEGADSDREAVGYVVDAIEHFEDRIETFDAFVPELRAWGQSPIFAIAWRNLYADVVEQLYEHDAVAEHAERERTYRLVDDGIRLKDL
jgi:hypothetical protein